MASIERLALVAGWLVFLIPVALVVALWLPRRIRFYRQAKASQQFLDSSADLDLFALRAMASQPLYVLAGVSDDPVRAWRDGDRQVIDQLAAIELRRNGLRLPKNRLRGDGMKRHQLELPLGSGIDRGMTVISYGHYGRPVLVFPSEAGRAWDFENNGMVAAVAGWSTRAGSSSTASTPWTPTPGRTRVCRSRSGRCGTRSTPAG